MCQVRELVHGVNLFRRASQQRRVGLDGRNAGRFSQRPEFGQLLDAADLFHAGRVPFEGQGFAALSGLPVAVGNDGHATSTTVGRHLQHGDHALDRACLGRIELGDLGAEHGRARHQRHAQIGQGEIHAELLGAVRLGARIDTPHRLADDGKLLAVLERDACWHGLLHRCLGQRTIAGLLPGGPDHETPGRGQLFRREPPLFGGGGDQHQARPGANLAVLNV